MKKLLSLVLAIAMIVSLGVTALAAPPAPPSKEADTYTGPVIEYPDKELWFDTTLYHGFFSPYLIMKGNGDNTFDVDAFINSKQGELIMSRIKYELALVGEKEYASQAMIDYWADLGIVETAYLSDEVDEEGYAAHEWLTFVPEYMYAEENANKTYPVVFSFHGNGNTLFTGVNLGFVHICYDEGFMVVVPEAENSDGQFMVDNLESYLDQMEEMGYPIDRSRIYTSGMSKGGRCSMYLAQQKADVIAAASAHGSSFALDPGSELAMFDGENFNAVPLYLACGESDMNQLPMSDVVLSGLNKWSESLGGGAFVTADNLLGIASDKTYEREIDGTTYTFADAYNKKGENVMKIVGVEGLPHWVSYSYSKLAWAFMKQYSLVNGERVFNEELSVVEAVANCHIGAFGQAVDKITVVLSDITVLDSITADGFTIENASKFVGMIPCSPYVEKVDVEDGKLVLTMGGDEFLLYKSDGSEKQGRPLKITYSKDDVSFAFDYADIVADNGAIDKMHDKVFEGMEYYSFEPKSDEPLPLVVFLHGGNLAGLQKKALAGLDALVQPEFQAEHPCYVLAPTSMRHLNGEMGWTEDERALVVDLIQYYVDSGKIDASRIYITGNSMGSGGAINTALEYPDVFAAVMPMSGPLRGISKDETMQAQFKEQVPAIMDVPFMITIAKTDPVASYDDAVCMYEIMSSMGANVSTTFYEDSQLIKSGVIEYTHAADAMAKYDPSLYEWMFAQQKQTVTKGLVQREDGFYNYYDENGEQVKHDYIMTEDKALYFFNSNGIGVEIVYRYIADNVVQVFDNLVDSAFIVIGEEKAAVIDGMNGTVDMKRVAEFFTELPLIAIATHGHGDHIGGLQTFDEVYVHPGDFDLFDAHSDASLRFGMLDYGNYKLETGSQLDYTLVNIREDMIEKNANIVKKAITDGDVFDLGGISIECIHAPGHTAGMTVMLLQEARILITGDAANRYTQITGYPVEGYLETLLKLKAREADYDDVYASHGAILRDGTNGTQLADNVIDELIEGCKSVLDGTNEGFAPGPGAPTRWAFEMGAFGGRADGGCGNFMFHPNLIYKPVETKSYTVVKGDTLWGIARRYLGAGSKWNTIYEANKDIIKNPNLIYVGQVLEIPFAK